MAYESEGLMRQFFVTVIGITYGDPFGELMLQGKTTPAEKGWLFFYCQKWLAKVKNFRRIFGNKKTETFVSVFLVGDEGFEPPTLWV